MIQCLSKCLHMLASLGIVIECYSNSFDLFLALSVAAAKCICFWHIVYSDEVPQQISSCATNTKHSDTVLHLMFSGTANIQFSDIVLP